VQQGLRLQVDYLYLYLVLVLVLVPESNFSFLLGLVPKTIEQIVNKKKACKSISRNSWIQ